MYVSGFGPTIVLDTASGEELIGSPATEFSPPVRMAAVSRSEMDYTRFGSWIPPGLQHPSPSSVSWVPFAAAFSPDNRQLVIAAGKEVVVANTARPNNAQPTLTHEGSVMAAEFRPTGELVTAGDGRKDHDLDLGTGRRTSPAT